MKRTKKLSQAEVAKLSPMDLMLRVAQESLLRYGTALPPDTARAVAVPSGKDRPKVDWTAETHTCPKCNHKGPVVPDFGIRKVRGHELRQSYCNNCRASTNYHLRPYKNRTRNNP